MCFAVVQARDAWIQADTNRLVAEIIFHTKEPELTS